MTQEDKELLLKDLLARLPYGVQTLADTDKKFDGGIIARLAGIVPYTGKKIQGHLFYQEGCLTPFTVEEIRPYLRPMSSMTDEEVTELAYKVFQQPDIDIVRRWVFENKSYPSIDGNPVMVIDWLNEKMFDFRGLIPKGLAIEMVCRLKENNEKKELKKID